MTELSATETNTTSFGNNWPISRFNQLLIGVLIVQIAIAVIVFWPRGSVATGELLLGELAVEDVSQIVLSDGNDNAVTLAQRDGEWVLASAGDYPAKSDDITAQLEKLLALNTDRLVARTADSHKRLQVAEADYVRKIELTTPDGVQTLYIGSSPGAGATHVRLDGQNETYLTSQINTFELRTQPSGWINTLYFSVPRDDITRIELENANGTFVFERTLDEEGEPGEWSMTDLAEGETLDTSTVSTLLTRVSELRMVEPVGVEAQPEYGLDDPLVTVVLTAVDDEGEETTHTLSFGVQDSDSNYYVKSSDSEYIVRVSSFTGDALQEETREEFLVEPETEEDEAAATDDAADDATDDATGDATDAAEDTNTASAADAEQTEADDSAPVDDTETDASSSDAADDAATE